MPAWQQRLNELNGVHSVEALHTHIGVEERFHRFREVSGVPDIEEAIAQLNARLAARGVPSRLQVLVRVVFQ